MSPLSSRAYALTSGVTLLHQCFKRYCYVMLLQTNRVGFYKRIFSLLFARSMGGVVANRVLQSFQPIDS